MQIGSVIWTHAVVQKSNFYEQVARAVLNDANLYVFTRLDRSESTGLLVARITDVDLTGNKDITYFFKRQFAGFPEILQEQLSHAMAFKKTELELIARGEVL